MASQGACPWLLGKLGTGLGGVSLSIAVQLRVQLSEALYSRRVALFGRAVPPAPGLFQVDLDAIASRIGNTQIALGIEKAL